MNVESCDEARLGLFMDKMTVKFDMFCVFMNYGIPCNVKFSLVITEQCNWLRV